MVISLFHNSYNVGRSIKWLKKIFAYLIEVTCLNAYILKTHGQTGTPSYLHFQHEITVGHTADVQVCHHLSHDWTSLQHLPTCGSSLECVVCNKCEK